jgi:hypothetical protein
MINTTDSVVLQVIEDLDNRSTVGLKKYSTSLERKDFSLKDWLENQYTELLDAALYCKRAILELELA